VLLRALIASTEAADIWTIQSGVFPENSASLRLHATAGFRTIGIRERVGCHQGIWRNVVLIERRSTLAGHWDAGHTATAAKPGFVMIARACPFCTPVASE
jgi:hypothetical protein